MNVKQLLDTVSVETALGGGLGLSFVAMLVSGEARLKADDILIQEEQKREEIGITEPMTFGEKTKLTWHCYILPIVLWGSSTALIIWSHKIQAKKLLALASAYAITNRSFKEYRDKAKELLSAKKFNEIETAVDQDKVANMTVLDGDILATNTGDVLCLDAWGGQKFFSNAESIRQAVARCNQMMVGHVYLSLNTLYDEIGLPATEAGEELGWNSLFDDAISVHFSSVLDKEHIPALVMHLEPSPRPMYQDC